MLLQVVRFTGLGFVGLLLSLSVFAAPPRIISLAPHATELAYAAGMGEQLIAVSSYSDYPPEAQKLEQVASWQGMNVERILALKPDIVLAWRSGNPQRPLDQLANFGITIVYVDANTIDEVANNIEMLGQYSAYPDQAIQNAEQLRQQLAALKKKYSQPTHRPVFIQFGSQPIFTTSGETLQNQIVSLCGAKNVFADSKAPWPQVSREQVLLRKPQAIIVPGDEKSVDAVKKFWGTQLDVPIIAVNENWFNRSGPRILLAAEALCKQLEPVSGEKQKTASKYVSKQ